MLRFKLRNWFRDLDCTCSEAHLIQPFEPPTGWVKYSFVLLHQSPLVPQLSSCSTIVSGLHGLFIMVYIYYVIDHNIIISPVLIILDI